MIPSPRLIPVAAIVVVALALGAGAARAQNAAAEVLFRDGDRLMAEGKLAEACDAFAASNRVEARAGTLIRLGDCREKNRQLASAWSAYSDALARAKDPAKKAVALGKVESLEPRLTRLTIVVARPIATLAITRGGVPVDAALWGRAVPIDGGEYPIQATALGFEAWAATVVVPTEGGAVTVDVPPLTAVPAAVAPLTPAVDPLVTTAVVPDRDRGRSGRRQLALGLGAGGAVIVGAAVVFGLQAGSLEADAQRACPQVTCVVADDANDLLARARTRANLANLSYGVGGAAIAAGAVLWFLGGAAAPERGVAIRPLLSPAAAGVTVNVRF